MLFRTLIKHKTSYLMTGPYFIMFFIFVLMPIAVTTILSFTYYNLLEFPQWRGLDNYIRLFLDDDIFLIAVRNTLLFAFVTGPLSYILCIILAWFVNELPSKLRTVLILVFYFPSIAGNLYVIWLYIFSGDAYGLVNGFLLKYGIIREPILWLANESYNLYILMGVQLWMSLGAGFLAFIAGYQTIDKALYESGAIDGIKNRWQELWYITLPSMVPILLFGAVLQIMVSFTACDAISQALAGFPSVKYSAHTIGLHIMDYGMIRFEMGYASSISVVLVFSIVFINQVIQSMMKKISA